MSEPTTIAAGSLFFGIGFFLIGLGIFLWIMTAEKRTKMMNETNQKYEHVEQAALQNYAKNKLNINIPEYIAGERIRETLTFRQALEDKMVEELLEQKTTNKKTGEQKK